MYVESINISQKSSAPETQKRPPADKAINVEKPVKEPESSRVKALVADAQNKLSDVGLHFSVDRSSNTIMVTVTEESSGKVIREIPSSEAIQLAARMDEMSGLLFDKKG